MDNQSTTNKIKKISVDGVPDTADKSRNISAASVQYQVVGVVLGDSGHNILGAFEHHYVNRRIPADVKGYMRKYCNALKSRPIRGWYK